MTTLLQAHITGVGTSRGKDVNSDKLAVTATTKALLDAGLTYDDVGRTLACFVDSKTRISRSSFDTFGSETPITEVDQISGFASACDSVGSGQADCVLLVGIDMASSDGTKSKEGVVVAIVLVSQLYLTSRAYLKDSAIHIRASSLIKRASGSRSSNRPDDSRIVRTALAANLQKAHVKQKDIQLVDVRSSDSLKLLELLGDSKHSQAKGLSRTLGWFNGITGLASICEIVWQLRGWANDRPIPNLKNCLHVSAVAERGIINMTILSRSDKSAAPKWDEVENLRDGRERLGYNPATDAEEISHEDLESVRARRDEEPEEASRRFKFAVKGGDRIALARL